MAVLIDEDLMPFGKFKGEKMANVPAKYLAWGKRTWHKTPWTEPVLKYIWDNWDAIELELKKENDER